MNELFATGTTGDGTLAAAGALYPLTAVPVLNSLPGANATLYLDFDGYYDASWGGKSNITQPAFDLDGDPTTFTDTELNAIRTIWEYVAEDYAPFNINVSTVEPPSFANAVAQRIAIGGDGVWYSSTHYGGVSMINSFTTSSENVSWVFSKNLGTGTRAVGDAISHEAGHAFGLEHQSTWSGSTLTQAYSTGPGDGRAPIMGTSYSATRGLWWNGTTAASPTTYQDDMAMIARATNVFGYRSDDVGNSVSTAMPLVVSGGQLSGSGMITTTTDVDYFSFTTGGGQVTVNVNVSAGVANLDARLELRSSTGSLIASVDPSAGFGATITAILASGSYRVVVGSHGSYGDVGQYTVTGTIVAGETINAPTSLAAQATSNTQIGLTWLDNATNETGYNVLRSNDGLTWSNFATLSANSSSYTDTSVSAGSTYFYMVQAFNTAVTSDNSNSATATTAPLAPGGLSATAVSSSQINLSWSDVSGETGYTVERSLDGLTWSQVGTTGANVTSYQNTGLSAGTTFSYRVRATNSGGDSATSLVASATTLTAVVAPSVPTGLSATATSTSQINLSWSDVSSETGYKVERSLDGLTWSQIGTTGANVTTFQNTGLTASMTYFYRVRATNSGGDSASSLVANATTLTAVIVVVPTAPSGLVAIAVSSRQVNLSWTDASNNETGFAIDRGTVNKFGNVSWAEIARTGVGVSTFSDGTVSRNKNYVYRVRAYNGAGMSTYSNQASVTTPSAALSASLSITRTSASLTTADSISGGRSVATRATTVQSLAHSETATTSSPLSHASRRSSIPLTTSSHSLHTAAVDQLFMAWGTGLNIV